MSAIERERAALLRRVVRIFAIVGLLAYVPSVIVSITARMIPLAILDSLAYFFVVLVAVLPRGPFRPQLFALVGSVFAVGTVVLVMTGPFGAGLLWIMCGVILSALFGSVRVVIATIGLAVAILAGYGFLASRTFLSYAAARLSFLVIAGNMFAICIALASVIHATFEGLVTSIGTQELLSQELHHRVKNNLQVTLSLISLEAYGAEPTPSIVALERRVRILTVVNELFLARPETLKMDVRAIARGVAGCAQQWTVVADDGFEENTASDDFRMDSADAAHFAIGVAELLNALAPSTVLVAALPRTASSPPRIRLRLEAGSPADRIEAVRAAIARDAALASLMGDLSYRSLEGDASEGPGFEIDTAD